MTICWVITENHEYDVVGIVKESVGDVLYVSRPALVAYSAGGYILENNFLPYGTVDLAKEGVVMAVDKRRALFTLLLDSEESKDQVLVQEYLAYLQQEPATVEK